MGGGIQDLMRLIRGRPVTAPPPGRLDPFSVIRGREDEPELPLQDNGLSYEDDYEDQMENLRLQVENLRLLVKQDENRGELILHNFSDEIHKEEILYKKPKEYFVRPGTSMGDNGGNHQSGSDLDTNDKPIVILDTGAQVNVTGDGKIFDFGSAFYIKEGYVLRAANGNEMKSYWGGHLSHNKYTMNYVYFCKELGPRTIISVAELDLLGYSSKFEGGTCEVRDRMTGSLVGEGRRVENTYLMDYLNIPLDRVPVSPENEEDMAIVQVPNLVPVPPENEEDTAIVQVPSAENVRPLSALTPAWTAIRAVMRRFYDSVFKQASEQPPPRPQLQV